MVNPHIENPPATPATLTGPSELKVDDTGTFSAMTTDPDNDYLQYIFNWTEGATSETALQDSGRASLMNHAWKSSGSYQVTVMARDEHGMESGWSQPLTVHVTPRKEALLISVNPNTEFSLGSSSAQQWASQSFVANGSRINSVTLPMKRIRNPTFPVQVMIRTSQNPASGTTLGQVTWQPVTIPSIQTWIDAVFPTPVEVTRGATYYVVMTTGNGFNSANYFIAYADWKHPYRQGRWYSEAEPSGNPDLDAAMKIEFG
jgi:hypothetical protein